MRKPKWLYFFSTITQKKQEKCRSNIHTNLQPAMWEIFAELKICNLLYFDILDLH